MKNEEWRNLLRGQMAITGQVLEENAQWMVTELVLADEIAAQTHYTKYHNQQTIMCEAERDELSDNLAASRERERVLADEIEEGDYWMKRAKSAEENGSCPSCHGGDEEGHNEGCYWGQIEAENERLKDDLAASQAEIRSLRQSNEALKSNAKLFDAASKERELRDALWR
jgi:transcription initiation factor IIF auxiliary subunit